jgi:hypothetical protein
MIFSEEKKSHCSIYKINTSYHSSLKIVLVYDINCNLYKKKLEAKLKVIKLQDI